MKFFPVAISLYGLFVLTRTVLQLFFASKNNRDIQHQSRLQIIKVLEEKTGQKFSQKDVTRLCNLANYREFRNEIQKSFPHFLHREAWNSLMSDVFLNLGLIAPTVFPPVFVVVPIYRPESLAEVEATVQSIQHQSYPAIREILLCFNDPSNKSMQEELICLSQKLRETDPRISFTSIGLASKRRAMYTGFLRHGTVFVSALNRQLIPFKKIPKLSYLERSQLDPHLNAISVNIDCDTRLDFDAISLGVMLLLQDPLTTAITSNVEIRNSQLNFLTTLTAARYKSANVVERAAQSFFHTVRCMSGPYMMLWTRNLLIKSKRGNTVADEWVNETFLSVKVEPGDDRSLTIRQNEQGQGVRFHPDILVTTDCPVSWKRWQRQQLRWMRSGNRNFIISLPFLFKLPLYIIFDDLYLFFLPYCVLAIWIELIFKYSHLTSFLLSAQKILFYLLLIFGIHFFRSLHLAVSQKNWRFLWLSLYFLIYVRYLIWLKLLAILTITQSEWTGRSIDDFSADRAITQGGQPM